MNHKAIALLIVSGAFIASSVRADEPSNVPVDQQHIGEVHTGQVEIHLNEEQQRVLEMKGALEKQAAEIARRQSEAAGRITADKLYLKFDDMQTPFRYRGVQGWWNAVDQYSRLTNDATSMAVAAVLQASELLKPRGAPAQIEYFEQLLPQVKNDTVRRAIRLQLIDAYKQANQQEKALDELQTLITAAPKATH